MKSKLILLGVAVSAVLLSEAVFAQADWTAKSPAHVPPKRLQTAMAQYGSGGTVVMFGGLNLGPNGVFNQHNVLGDTWIWNGTDWSPFTTNLAVPPARYGASMAYDPTRGQAVLFGGQDASGKYLSDTWTFYFSSFCIGTVCRTLGPFWGQVAGTVPPARAGASMAYDPDTSSVILTGGANGSVDFADTWQFQPSTNTWTQLATLSSISPPRANAAMAQCNHNNVSSDNLVMLFGGGFFKDTWALGPFDEGIGVPWTLLSPANSPPARSFHAMAYYPVTSSDVLYGGEAFSEIGAQVFSDTWTGNCIQPGNWTQQSPAHNPGPRMSHAMTTGPSGLTVVLFGGSDLANNSHDRNDTWTWGKRVACVPVDGSQIPEGARVDCRFEPADGLHFAGWNARGFDPEFRHKVEATFLTDDTGPGSITAQWTDSSGLHSQTFSYTIVEKEHGRNHR